ncbi:MULTISPECIES: T9SS type B sorting domain-containing protein [unclassified Flavobacterium]|uniref:T9SS type B sorting domain-containing protein n=1 Tax=unclassified Flavobacterium TaxID=196869 RepID=UPI001F13960A|nr:MULTISPECIES: T9SS type B sorting domain-containing protein [unclassified Flavobacterium]UMY64383.1 T9SS type B sorting domain-containing protein [Flavobacterium sp. HJ-32-4]
MGFRKLGIIPFVLWGTLTFAHTTLRGAVVAQALQPDTATVNQNTTASINVLGNDILSAAGGNVMAIAASPTYGTATINTNGTPGTISDDTILYTPYLNYTGTDSFNYSVTDVNGVSQTVSVSITVNPVALSITTSVLNESCPDANNGSIIAYAKNGITPYTFFTLSGQMSATSATGVFTGLEPGTYNVTITSSSGATATASNLIVYPANDLNLTSDTTICAGNPKQLTVSGGGATYAWTSTPTDASLTPGGTIQNVAPTQTTVYTVTSTIPLDRNLIANPSFSQGNKFFYSDYTFAGNNNSNIPRRYGVLSNTSAWSTDYGSCSDHTGSNDQMLIVSGSHTNGGNDIVWKQIVPVASGQNYLFKYWIQNLSGSNPANMVVKINGVQVGGVNAVDPNNACGTWIEHTYAWASGSATTAEIAIYDTTVAIAGNDFAIDDISMKRTGETCTMTKSVTISTVNQLTATIDGPVTQVCPGYSAPLTFTGTPFTTITFTSPAGNGSVTLNAQGTATYSPFVLDTTTFTLGTATNGTCSNPLTGSFTIYVYSTSAAPCTSEQPFPYPTANVQIEAPVPVCYAGGTTTLKASYYLPRPTTGYGVKSIPYQNLYSYTGGTPMDATQDDIFTPPFTIPFNFCFYGNNYSQLTIGTNGMISFDLSNSGNTCPYFFSQSIPSAAMPVKNAIFAVYQDTNIASPPVTNTSIQNVNYYVGGVAPNRYFVANFNELPQFKCNNTVGLQTYQAILHETTNIIDIYIKNRTPCTTWNPTLTCCGNGLTGVINSTGTQGVPAPGRNTGTWSASNEGWRFYPSGSGASQATVQWTDSAGNVVGMGDQIQVPVNGPEIYTVKVTYTTCYGTFDVTDSIAVDVEPSLGITDASDITVCGQSTGPFNFGNINQDAAILTGLVQSDYDVSYYLDPEDARNWAGNSLTPAQLANYTVTNASDLPRTIYVRVTEVNPTLGCDNYTQFTLDAFSPGGSIAYPQSTYNITVPNTTAAVTMSPDLETGGTFASDVSGIILDPATGLVNVTSSAPGTYNITYTVSAPGCPSYTTPPFTLVLENTCIVDATASQTAVCSGTNIDLFASGTEINATYAWTGPSFTSNQQNPAGVVLPTTPGDYVYHVDKTVFGSICASDDITISVYEIPTAAFAVSTFPACVGDTPSVSVTGTPNAVVTVYEQGTTTPISVTLDATGVGSFTTLAVTSTGMVYELTRAESTTTPVCATDYTPGTVTVTITTTPPTATVAAPPTAVCSGDTATFTVTGTPNGVVNYTLGAAGGSVTLDGAGTAPVTTGPITAGVTITLNSIVSGSCTTPLSATASASVLPLPTASFTATTTICAQQAAVIDFTGTPNAQVTFTDSNGTSNTITLTAGGTYQYTSPYPMTANGTFTLNSVVSATTPACTQTLNQQLNFTVNALPAVTQDPAPATQAACEGSTVTFTAAGTGAGVGYQWYGPSGLITGANNATLTLTNITLAQEGNYYVEVSGTCAPSPLSANAFLDVTDAPAITSLAANTVLCEGSNYSITVNATGDNLSYEWRNAANLVVGNTATLTIASITPANAGTYTVTVSGAAGCTPVSQSTTLTINALPQITTQPVGATICEDEGYTFTVAATESLLNFNWYHGSPAALVKSGPDNFLTVAGTMADEGTYYVEVTNPCLPSPGVTSTTVTLNIEQKPRITVQPLSPAPMCTGENFTLSVTATGENLGYQWYGPDGNPIAGATSTSYSVTGAQVNQSGNYFVRVSNTLGECSPVDSTPATITVNQGPAWTVEPGDLNLCVGEAILLSSQASGDALTYSWYKDGVDLNVHTPDLTIAAADVDVTDAGIYRVEVTSPTCPLIFSEAIVLVYPAPQATIANGNEPEICEGQSADVVFSGTPNAVVTYTINGGAPQTIVLSPGGQAILATGQLDATTEYTLVSVITGSEPYCSAPLAGLPNTTAIVKVDRIPDVDLPQDTYLCFDAAGNLLGVHDAFETGLDPAIYSFQWYFEGNPIAGATGSGYTPDSAGQYRVEITNNTTNCTSAATAPVVSSTAPTSITAADVTTGYFADTASIVVTVDPVGDYEYRLDDGPWQTSNTFTGVSNVLGYAQTGSHTVYARDLKSCGQVEYAVYLVDYPKYFTPNGDGIHDTWNIPVISGQPGALVYIFDRSGKLLKQIYPSGTGWDGTFNGNQMPADDYWFLIQYEEAGITKEFKAHFTLKR